MSAPITFLELSAPLPPSTTPCSPTTAAPASVPASPLISSSPTVKCPGTTSPISVPPPATPASVSATATTMPAPFTSTTTSVHPPNPPSPSTNFGVTTTSATAYGPTGARNISRSPIPHSTATSALGTPMKSVVRSCLAATPSTATATL